MKRERDQRPGRHYYDFHAEDNATACADSPDVDDSEDDDDHVDQQDGDSPDDDGDVDGAYNSDSDGECANETRKVGRPVERFLLHKQHPLEATHVVVRRAKTAVPALAGNPPPKLPGQDATPKQKDNFAAFYCALFVPWHCLQDTEEPTMDKFDAFWQQLEHDACLHRARESDESDTDDEDEEEEPRRRRRKERGARLRCRTVASGRLSTMKQHIDGIQPKSAVVTLVQRHRARARTIWNAKNRPACLYDEDDDDKCRRREKALRKLLEEIEKLRGVDCVTNSVEYRLHIGPKSHFQRDEDHR